MTTTAFCFDLDGTITLEEILPLIAEATDLADEIAVLTQATIGGVLPFEKSFRLRCRLLAEVPLSEVRATTARVRLDPDLEAFVRDHADQAFVVTGNLDAWVEPVLRRLGCGAYTSTARVDGDRLLGVDRVLHKADPVEELRERFDRIVAIGDGMNDVPMLEAADIGVVHGAVHPPAEAARDVADYWTMNGRGLCRLLSSLS